MNAADTIAAAIDKLEAQRRAAVPGPWRFDEDSGGLYLLGPELPSENIPGFNVPQIAINFQRDWDTEDAAAELIVTLHRTIDAQLAILRDTYDSANLVSEEHFYPIEALSLDLARAILGES